MSLSKRLLRIGLTALGGIMAIILILLLLLLATPVGGRVLVWQAEQHLPQLTVGSVNGSVLGGLTLNDLRLSDPQVLISRVHLNVSSRALLKPELVVQKLTLDGLSLTLEAGNESQATTSQKSSGQGPLDLPEWLVPLRLRSLTINKAQLILPGADIQWQSLQLSAQLVEGHFTLAPLTLSKTQISLKPAPEPLPKTGPWPLAKLPDLPAPLPITLKRIQIQDLSVQQGEQTHKLDSASVALNWQQHQLQLQQLAISSPDYGRFDLTAETQLNWPYRVDAQASVSINAAILPKGLNLSPVELSLNGQMDDLRWSVQEQSLALSSKGQITLTDANTPFNAKLGLDSSRLSPLLPPELNRQLWLSKLHVTMAGDSQQQRFSLTQPFAMEAWGSQNAPAQLQLNASHSKGLLALNELLIQSGEKQRLLTQGQLTYQNGLSWQLDTALTRVPIPQTLTGINGILNGQVHQQGQWLEAQWWLKISDLELDGQLQHQPFKLTANARLGQHEQWFVDQLTLSAEAMALNLDAQGKLTDQWQLQGTLNSESVAGLLPQAEGSLTSQFHVSGPQQSPQIMVRASGEQWYLDNVQMDNWQLDADYRPLRSHAVEAALTLGKTRLRGYRTAGQLHLSGDRQAHKLTLSLDGDIGAQVSLSGGMESNNSWQGQVIQANWKLPYERLSLDKPIALTLGAQSHVQAHCWQGQFSQWCLNQPLNWPLTQTTELSAQVDYGPWASHWLTDQQLRGQAEINARLTPGNRGPELSLTGSSSPGHWYYQGSEQPLELLSWSGGKVKLETGAEAWDLALKLNQTATLPIVDLQGQLNPQTRQLSAKLALPEFDLNKLLPVIPSLDQLAGNLNARVQAQGPLESPELTGQITVSKAEMRIAATQTHIQQGHFDLNFTGRQLDYESQFIMGQGQAELEGQAQWQPGEGPWHQRIQASAWLQGHQLELAVLPELQASLSPNLHLNLDKQLSVTGQLTVDNGKLTLSQLPESAVQVSDDMVIQGQTQQDKTPLPINLALALVLDEPFVVEAFDFVGAIDGQLTASQTSPEPLQLFGNLDVTRGRYQAYGQDLQVQQGRVQFIGTPSNPVVQISAIRPLKNTDVKAGIRASGPASNLSVELFSDPTMDQQTILSYILTGRKPDDSGPQRSGKSQALLLAANQGISLTGGSLGQALNQVPVINDVTFDTEANASGQALATVSGYIGDRLYLKYGVGLLEPVNELTVRYYLLDQLWLEALSSIDRSVDLYYQFTIDEDEAAPKD
ncbi:Translocation and assembly module TamB [Saliniradius amylolyticus]|uniref:Translocation and assembly module TamB n=1 Tax=Saliniradius amylolyticus TaxID=2183582 RepID=A0A2S2E6I2_9ALTE|nr:translocation/assembly module TamB domain-containing protein [Saliniradius amylolyticus]AWL12860.1 Translocation and assembly module TamB [Saliniradius amylolyticus]